MDFSKYKKVKEDKNSTTMMSDGGHTITLIHKTMPRIQVEQLKRLKMNEGGRIGIHIPGGEKRAKMSDAGDPADAAAEQDVPVTQADAAPVQAPQGQPNPAVGMAQPDVSAPMPAQQPYAPNVDPQTGQTNSEAVNANAQATAQNQGQVNAAAAQAEIPQNVAYIKAMQQVAQEQQDAYNDIAKHTSDFAQHMQGVDPQHFVKNMPGGEKVATSLGLLIGGFTQGFHGGANPASDWLNNQINRDIDAQKNAQDVNKTVYGAYRQLYGDSTAAINATKASMADIYAQMGKQIALKYGTPQAQINAQNLANTAAAATPKLLKEGAVSITSLPGSRNIGGGAPQPGGHSGAGAKHGNAPQTPQDRNPNSILVPGALDKVKAGAYGDPRMAADFAPGGQGAQQLAQASRADEALADIPDLVRKMQDDVNNSKPFGFSPGDGGIGQGLGNVAGYAQRNMLGSLEHIPYGIGDALKTVTKPLAYNPANTNYNIHREQLKSAMLGAVGGTPAGSGDVNAFLDSLSTESGATPENVANTIKGAEDVIKKHQAHDVLDKWNLTREYSKKR